MSKRISLYDSNIVAEIPEDFTCMSREEAEEFFKLEMPEQVYSNRNKSAFITLNRNGQELTSEGIEKRLNEYYTIHTRVVPNFKNASLAKRSLENGVEIGALQYTSTSATKDLYNTCLLIPVDGKEVVITMHCELEQAMTQGKEFLDVLASIEWEENNEKQS